MNVSELPAPSLRSASYTASPSGLVRAIAVSVMQITTTRPTGSLSTHLTQRLLSASVSLYRLKRSVEMCVNAPLGFSSSSTTWIPVGEYVRTNGYCG
jgi:hypothetical protein